MLDLIRKYIRSRQAKRLKDSLLARGFKVQESHLLADCSIDVRGTVQDPDERLTIGSHTYLQGRYSIGTNGRLTIGDHCSFRSGTHINVKDRVTIGNHVFAAPGIFVTDNDNHPLSPRLRKEMTETDPGTPAWSAGEHVVSGEVVIEDGVWIGRNAIVLKGVRIGRWSIIGAGAIVVGDVPEFSVAVGNPARVVRHLENDLE